MNSFLDLFVSRTDDVGAKARVAQALTLVFPGGADDPELTHARAALSPIWHELIDLTSASVGDLPTEGRKREEPLLTLAIEVARTELYPWLEGYPGRRQYFRAIVELVAADPRGAKGHDLRLFAAQLRLELERRRAPEGATAVSALPDFPSVLDLVRWLDDEANTRDRFSQPFRDAWQHSLSRKLKFALFNPVPPPSDIDTDDESSSDTGVIVSPTIPPGVDSSELPIKAWVPHEPATHAERVRSPGTAEVALRAELSTLTPISRFTVSSTTVLTDVEMRKEVARLLDACDAAHADHDLVAESLALARSLVATTATPGKFVLRLTWGATDQRTQLPRIAFPGFVTPDAEWLLRAELSPSRNAGANAEAQSGGVWIPLPRSLGTRLIRLHNSSVPGTRVFEALASHSFGLSDEGLETRPSLTALRRTLVSRLMRAEPLGISGAQWVAGDDFGLDRAPLFYDRIEADRLATIVARITFPWFGERHTQSRRMRPSHFVGSRRMPDIRSVQSFFESLRQPAKDGLVDRVRQRARNLVHGLAACSGHRPNNSFGKLTLGDFAVYDPVATLSDKKVSVDWRTRPVVVPATWRAELRAYLRDLSEAACVYLGRPLGTAASSALANTGPIFLDVSGEEEVKAFDLDAYRQGVPEDLLRLGNFARQILNSRLTGVVPEALRVGQMGWHGTREGAWAEGSPWSVLSAAMELEGPLDRILRELGWRPLQPHTNYTFSPPQQRLAWVELEEAHQREFRAALSHAQKATAARQAKMAREGMLPRLPAYLSENLPALMLSDSGRLIAVPRSGEQKLAEISARESQRLIEFLSGGDLRSEESIVARNLVSTLIGDARKRGVVSGPIPRRAILHWPSKPGAFASGFPSALATARVLDSLICEAGIPEAARAACSLLLHGGYADVDAVMRAMALGSRLLTLESQPGILLVQPTVDPVETELGSDIEGSSHLGSLAYHGLGALHLVRWHRSGCAMPTESEIDAQIYDLLPESMRPMLPNGTLRQIAALARACNALRMDGWARLVGTSRARPRTECADRVLAIRDNLPMGPRAKPATGRPPSVAPTNSDELPRHARSLLDRSYQALGEAAQQVDTDARRDLEVRKRLGRMLRAMIEGIETPGSQALIVLFAIALLDRGGMRRSRLEISTIQSYVHAIGRPLARALPDTPLSAAVEEWEAAYESVVAQTSDQFRLARAQALTRFHWVLSQEFNVPNVSFATTFALCTGGSDLADAGFVTECELDALFAALAWDIHSLETNEAEPEDIHAAKARRLAAAITVSGALRPGEAERIQAAQLHVSEGNAVLEVRKTATQRLKSSNSRRRTQLRGKLAAQTASAVSQWTASNRARKRSSDSVPLFHAIEDPNHRLDDATLFSRTADLLRWATGSIRARPYWLRKAGVRARLELLQAGIHASLWPLRDMLAEIAHGEPMTTLNWYTHDPVTPFLRWFGTGWDNISAERISSAIGRSISSVARRRGGPGLTKASRDGRARVAKLLETVDETSASLHNCLIELPEALGSESRHSLSLAELHRVLQQVARGDTVSKALQVWSLPLQYARRIDAVLRRLEAEFMVSLRPTHGDAELGFSRIAPPRQLSEHGGVCDLIDVDSATSTLAEMGECWLRAAQYHGLPNGVPCTPSDWDRWSAQVPLLNKIIWDDRSFGRAARIRLPTSKESQKVGPWPMLRWIILVAWLLETLRRGQLR